MGKYILVNPKIEGTIKTKVNAETALEAANLIFKEQSQYFSNNLPKFIFSLKKKDEYFHFIVREKINKNNNLKYKISLYNKNINPDELQKIYSNNLKGGHSKYNIYSDDDESDSSDSVSSDSDSSDSDSSDSDSSNNYDYLLYKPLKKPITYWSYYSYIYPTSNIYIPTFVPTLRPYININFTGLP
jgi:hypothetical protein